MEPEPLEEQRGGAEHARLTWTGVPADLGDEATLLEGAEHPVDADPPDGGDLPA